MLTACSSSSCTREEEHAVVHAEEENKRRSILPMPCSSSSGSFRSKPASPSSFSASLRSKARLPSSSSAKRSDQRERKHQLHCKYGENERTKWEKNYQQGFVGNRNRQHQNHLMASSNRTLSKKRRKKMRNVTTRSCFEYKTKKPNKLSSTLPFMVSSSNIGSLRSTSPSSSSKRTFKSNGLAIAFEKEWRRKEWSTTSMGVVQWRTRRFKWSSSQSSRSVRRPARLAPN